MLLTLAVTYFVSQNLLLKAQQDFRVEVLETEAQIHTRIEAYIALLRGGGALFAVEEWVTSAEFRAFVTRLRMSDFYGGAQGLGFAVRINEENREEFLPKIQADFPGFKIWPDEGQSEAFPISLLEPIDERNEAAIGYDMFTNPVRRHAMMRARDSALPSASGKVRLVQEIKGPEQPGFLIYLPVYSGGGLPETVEERRRKIQGFIYSPFRAHDFLRVIAELEKSSRITFEVYDGTEVSPENLLFDSTTVSGPSAESRRTLETVSTMEIAGHPWTIRYISAPDTLRAVWIIPLLLVVGLLLTFVFSYLTYAEARARRRTEQVNLDLQRSQAAYKASEERFRIMVEQARGYAIFMLDPEGRISSWNSGAERILGYTDEEIIGRSGSILFTPEDQRNKAGEIELQTAKEKGSALDERLHMRKDGSRFFCSGYMFALRDENGALRGFSKIMRDITEKKRQEEDIQRLNQELELRVEQRTAALRESYEQMETFTYTVAHDLRGPLRSMLGFSQAILEENEDHLDESSRDYLDRIMRASARMDALIQDLLAYSHLARIDLKFEPVNLQDVINDVLNILAAEVREKHVTIIAHGPFPNVYAHQATLHAVLCNLVSNAIKFSSSIASPRVELRAETKFHEDQRIVRCWVIDNGIGIPDEHYDRIFRVFERLHGPEKYSGTGIGLAIVKKGIERMNGRVGVESKRNEGSRFWIELPAA